MTTHVKRNNTMVNYVKTTHVKGKQWPHMLKETMSLHEWLHELPFSFIKKKTYLILILVTSVKGKNMMVKDNNMKRTLERLSLLRKKWSLFVVDNLTITILF